VVRQSRGGSLPSMRDAILERLSASLAYESHSPPQRLLSPAFEPAPPACPSRCSAATYGSTCSIGQSEPPSVSPVLHRRNAGTVPAIRRVTIIHALLGRPRGNVGSKGIVGGQKQAVFSG